MNAVHSYDPIKKEFSMEWEGSAFFFKYDRESAAVKTVRDGSGRIIARSYKGFRNYLGIKPASARSQEFVNLFKICRSYV